MKRIEQEILSHQDVKLAIVGFLATKGIQAKDTDSFTINPDGSITVEEVTDDSIPIAVPAKPVCNTVVVGEATTFGLNYDGSPDPQDNGIGAWGAKTANKEIVGVSLPEGVMIMTFGFSGSWKDNAAKVGEFLGKNAIRVSVTRNSKTVLADVVDAGPAQWTHNAIDLTYALSHMLETNGKAIVSYSIIKDGAPMEVKGWDFVNGVEIKSSGIA